MPEQGEAKRGRIGRYVRGAMRHDLMAGLTVAVVALPQSMAYAIIAGAPPAFGLYTSIVSCFIGALAGSSRHLVTGPTNATALIFAATLSDFSTPLELVQAIALYTLLIGVIKLACGLLRLGVVMNYISESVVTGFIAGAGILIAGNQLKNLFGLETGSLRGESFLMRIYHMAEAAGTFEPWALAVGCVTIGLMVAARLWWRRFPSALAACVVCAVAVELLHLREHGVTVVGDGGIGHIPQGLPPLTLPPLRLDLLPGMASGAFAVAVLSLMEATVIAKALAGRTGQHLDINREFTAQGLATLGGAFFGNFASSGSPTRSWINYQSGAQTRMAAAFSGLFVALIVVLFGPLGNYIPLPSLAGILVVSAVSMVDFRAIRWAFRAGGESTTVLLATLLATLILRLDYAIYLGVLVSLAFYIQKSTGARITLLVPAGSGKFREIETTAISERELAGHSVVINLVGALYFGAMDDHQSRFRRIIESNPKAIILRLRRVSNIDSSGMAALSRWRKECHDRGIPLTVCGVDESHYNTLRRSGLLAEIGEDRVIRSHDLTFNSIEAAVDLAETLAEERRG